MRPETISTYRVKVGPYWHEVDKATGKHWIVQKDAKVEQAFTYDKAGTLHVTRPLCVDPVDYAISQLKGG